MYRSVAENCGDLRPFAAFFLKLKSDTIFLIMT